MKRTRDIAELHNVREVCLLRDTVASFEEYPFCDEHEPRHTCAFDTAAIRLSDPARRQGYRESDLAQRLSGAGDPSREQDDG
jgi:hypothetical protein